MNEMLEQIRVVVREELERMNKQLLMPSEAVVMSGEELTKQLQQWKPIIQPAATSTDDSSPVVKQREYDPEIEGHSSLDTELVHAGKLYKGILHYVKDVES